MKLEEVFRRVDDLKSNAYRDDMKADWINAVEGRVQLEILERDMADVVRYDWETDGGADLVVPEPYSDLYLYYVEAMIDFYNKEYEGYNNSMVMFNEAFEEYRGYIYRLRNAGQNIRNIW